MTNTIVVCLFAIIFCADLSTARQVPKECSKGPDLWCQSLRRGADCGAVGHCIGTVWEKQNMQINTNEVSTKFVRLFRQLKDVKDLINEDYLATRVSSACHDVAYPQIAKMCKENTAHLEDYLLHVLKSETPAATMCQLIGMCNNEKIDNVLALNKKKAEHSKQKGNNLLGSAKCTWGPSYWCSNFSTGRECKATHHCVSRVWSKMTFPEDNDSICKICTDMVQQARDQLQSNETQEELKEVFEGSCQLIPIKIVRKECIKLADDFVPELVETLSSQMNPQAVCSVAGLCNNDRIDKLLVGYNANLELRAGCNNCRKTVGVLRQRFDSTSYENFLVNLLKVCGNMASLSDSCSMLVFKYYENIVEAVKKDLTPQSVCHVSGQCAYKFHSHDEYDFPEEWIGFSASDDVPCEFCEQLVKHLGAFLHTSLASMTFRTLVILHSSVLKATVIYLASLCKQTGEFKDECLHLAEQYYPMVYNYLVSNLEPKKVCSMMGICGNISEVPVLPLVPKEIAVKAQQLKSQDSKVARVPITNKQTNVRVMTPESTPAQLPIERMFVQTPQVEGKGTCSFCQYFLHYLQVELSDTKNEDKIKNLVENACKKLPKSVMGECNMFVEQYGPMVIALLVQEIDPASICPALDICPKTEEVKRVSINSDKSNCPLCLFAVEQLETMLKNNRSEENIRKALDKLCNHLAQKLRTECVDFVDTYANQLVEMLVANMNAQEICVFLKLCEDKVHDPLEVSYPGIDKYHDQPQLRGDRNNFRKTPTTPKTAQEAGRGDIETNEIPDNTVNGRVVKPEISQNTVCVLCEFIMKEIDGEIKDKGNADEVKKALRGVCNRMPKSVRSDCDKFVEKYADLVISMLAQELDPDEVCQELKLCQPTIADIVKAEEILDCAVCETVVMAVKKVLSNDKVDRNIVHIVEKSCGLLPAKYSVRCHTLMEIYGDSIIHLIETYGAKGGKKELIINHFFHHE
ncbi:hypothetical protein K1T71_008919 [Dendrolimus kikuchii]|uniref:Uncharacterized protein n=1 Tax=Dendrolimus kikuchii TaxID=765133 RepID=A0ACC1CWA1_9NEOP|nr:hypothetical protein K1T71_008919 [Dendrolimus kikuchii]